MSKSIMMKSLVAALVATGTIVPATVAMAQQKPVIAAPRQVLPAGVKKSPQPIRYKYPIQFRTNPFLNWRRNITVSPAAAAQARARANTASRPVNTNVRPVVMTPNRGPIGTQIRVQLNRNLGATPNLIRFRAVVTNGVPAQLLVRVGGGGNLYTTSAPIQMCIQGGGRWDADLLLTNGQRIDNIGSFTPTNCPR